MTLLLLANLGYAGGAGVVVPGTLGDLTTLFRGYLDGLQDTVGYEDADTLVVNDLDTVRAAVSTDLDDANTVYARYLS